MLNRFTICLRKLAKIYLSLDLRRCAAFEQESYHLMKLLLTFGILKKKESQRISRSLLEDWRKDQYLFFHNPQFEVEIIEEEKCKDENLNGITLPKQLHKEY